MRSELDQTPLSVFRGLSIPKRARSIPRVRLHLQRMDFRQQSSELSLQPAQEWLQDFWAPLLGRVWRDLARVTIRGWQGLYLEGSVESFLAHQSVQPRPDLGATARSMSDSHGLLWDLCSGLLPECLQRELPTKYWRFRCSLPVEAWSHWVAV